MTALDRVLFRAAYLAATAAVVLALFVLAPVFAHELHWFGLSDHTLHFTGHLVVYGAVALGLAMALGRFYALAWPLALIIAAAEELHQAYVPGRCVDLRDYLVNAVSITLAVLAFAAVNSLWERALRRPVAAAVPAL